MQGVDLQRFQFDYDLTAAIVCLNADGTVYGRYGARDGRDAMALNSLPGLRKALLRILELHRNYPANRATLAKKRGPAPRYTHAEEFPVAVMEGKGGAPTRKNCIHCHQVHEAQQQLALQAGTFDVRDFATRFPPPSQVGLTLDRDDGTRIRSVESGTPAARAGLEAGDRIRLLGGQAITSIADVIWVLDHAGKDAKLAVVVERGDSQDAKPLTLELATGWRKPTLAWRASMYSLPPAPGLWVSEIKASAKARLQIPKTKLALRVRGLFRPAVRKSGLAVGDVIVAVDGFAERMRGAEFHAYLRLQHSKPPTKLRLRVRRGDKERDIVVTFR